MPVAAVCLAASLPYLSTLDNYYVRDDFGVVQLLASKPWDYFPRWFVTSWMDGIWGFVPDEIRPFPAVSYQITAFLGGGDPRADHIVNIIFHVLNSLLVLATARLMAGLGMAGSTFAAVCFAVLPNQAETVAWITGRVDSMPSLFYLAALLAYARWRAGGAARSYWYSASVVFCFAGLFTKQNVVTLIGMIALYDWLVVGRPVRLSWTFVRPYAPFAALTVAYLWLRFLLFGEIAREGRLTQHELAIFVEMAGRHSRRVVFGSESSISVLGWMVLFGGAAAAFVAALRAGTAERVRTLRKAVYFGPVWWAVGVAPVLVAGYLSSRHVYLASVAWAMLAGLAFHLLWEVAGGRSWRWGAVLAGGLVLVGYGVQLQAAVGDWNRVARISGRAVADLERAASAVPDGTLIVAAAPSRSWEWALPFAAQPPFTASDLTARVFIISPHRLYCCLTAWPGDTLQTLRAWAAQGDRPPLLALYWDPESGALTAVSDQDDPALHDFVRLLLDAPDSRDLNRLMEAILAGLVADRRGASPPG